MLFFHCYCYLLFTVRTSSSELFVRLLCEININNMNIIKIMNCVPPKIKPYCLNV